MDNQVHSHVRTFTRPPHPSREVFCTNDATPAGQTPVGWLSTAGNAAVGFTLTQLEDFETSWLENAGVSTTDVFRASGDRVTTLVRINVETGTVAFFDNEHHVETGGCRFQRATAFRRVVFAQNFHAVRWGFDVL